jgi:HEAT repeat protein
MLKSSDSGYERVLIALSLTQIDKSSRDLTIPILHNGLKDTHPFTRKTAAESFGRLGADSKDAIPELTKLLDDEDESVQKAAAWALKEIRAQVDRK